ncbi:hypothetical protein GCM10010123_46320 [Pilimelia anulata]|uniref:Ferritin-like domain-containing protein n=1 Tax=Pilimelia anulata TaxID=53371 RepID=A0A8J3FGS4_9ACTN|nr:ferritin-like domain-containing protein [Pilimelia anulata]GGK11088.1 hypothetical protein GCM10010123_46320 [Pilimelia anulata]
MISRRRALGLAATAAATVAAGASGCTSSDKKAISGADSDADRSIRLLMAVESTAIGVYERLLSEESQARRSLARVSKDVLERCRQHHQEHLETWRKRFADLKRPVRADVLSVAEDFFRQAEAAGTERDVLLVAGRVERVAGQTCIGRLAGMPSAADTVLVAGIAPVEYMHAATIGLLLNDKLAAQPLAPMDAALAVNL